MGVVEPVSEALCIDSLHNSDNKKETEGMKINSNRYLVRAAVLEVGGSVDDE